MGLSAEGSSRVHQDRETLVPRLQSGRERMGRAPVVPRSPGTGGWEGLERPVRGPKGAGALLCPTEAWHFRIMVKIRRVLVLFRDLRLLGVGNYGS